MEAAGVQAPRFEVDPMWPKPLPNHWLLGKTIGVSVDAQDHIWIIHRAGSLEADGNYADHEPADVGMLRPGAAGSRVRSGGQPDRALGRPRARLRLAGSSNHGITVDYKGNVWIGGNGRTTRSPKGRPITTTWS